MGKWSNSDEALRALLDEIRSALDAGRIKGFSLERRVNCFAGEPAMIAVKIEARFSAQQEAVNGDPSGEL